MKMLLEEEENYDEQSKTKSLKNECISKDKSKCSDDDNQLMIQKEYGFINCEEKSQQYIQVILKKLQQKLSHVIMFDLLVDIDSKGSVQDQQEEQFRGFDLLHHMKPVYQVERKNGFVGFHIPERDVPLIDINYSIQLLESQQISVYNDFAKLLRQMQLKQKQVEAHMTKILERNNYDMEFMMKMKQKRQEYIQEYSQSNYLTRRDSKKEQFINIAAYSPCIINKSMHLSYLAKSKELIFLLGTDEEQIARIALKKSQMDVFSFESRNVIQQIYMNYVLHGITKHKEQNFNLLSYDNISIYCPAEFNIYQVKFPDDLQYDPELHCDDIVVVSHFDIEPFHVKKVLGIRKQFDELQRYIQNFDQDFEYNIQSEVFLQKFYKKVLKKIHKRDKVHELQEREIKSRTCGYRQVNQQKQ